MTFIERHWDDNDPVDAANGANMRDLEARIKALDDSKIGPSDLTTIQNSLTAYIDSKYPQLATTLPSSPANGKEVYYQNSDMAAKNVVWHLRYNSSSPSTWKWEYVGGNGLWSINTAGASFTTSSTPGTWAPISSPLIVAPLAGEYIAEVSWQGTALTDLRIDARTTAFLGSSLTTGALVANNGTTSSGVYVSERISIPTSGSNVQIYLSSTTASATGTSVFRSLRIRPITVG